MDGLMKNTDKWIYTEMDMEDRVLEYGFMPFFSCGIPGFSIKELTAPGLWFSSEADGPWEWKGPVIREGHCAYGKIFNKKAGYVSMEWLPDLVNYRRSRHYAKDEDTAALDDVVLQTITAEGCITVKELRRLLGFVKGRGRRSATEPVDGMPGVGKVSLDPILTRLMMGLRVVIADFEYNTDKHGRAYGWGVAKYTTPEALYGDVRAKCEPGESFRRIYGHLRSLFTGVPDKKILALIG